MQSPFISLIKNSIVRCTLLIVFTVSVSYILKAQNSQNTDSKNNLSDEKKASMVIPTAVLSLQLRTSL